MKTQVNIVVPETKEEEYHCVGNFYMCPHNELFLLSQTSIDQFCLISVGTGNRWKMPTCFNLTTYRQLAQYQFDILCCDSDTNPVAFRRVKEVKIQVVE